MTTQQITLFNLAYLVVLIVVAVLTRPTVLRLEGALAGGAVMGVVMLGIIALCEKAGLWHMVITWKPYFLTLMVIDSCLCGWMFLVSWRIARRFGWRGLALALIVVAIIGPPRDRWYMARFPQWGSYAPGIAPVLAISAAYVALLVVGHGMMRLVAGPAKGSPLARQPWQKF